MEFQEYLENHANFKNVNKSIRLEKDIISNQSEQLKANKRGNFILRQEMSNLTPECTIKFSIILNSILAICFAGIGIPIIISKDDTKEFEIQYDKW